MTIDSTKRSTKQTLRFDRQVGGHPEAWLALAQTPGIGVSITDSAGRLLFVNDTSLVLFSGSTNVDYEGKTIADFHPPEFVAERLEIIRRVLDENKPLSLRHIYNGRAIVSTIWPFRDKSAPFNRVLVVTRPIASGEIEGLLPKDIETVKTEYIGLGPLSVLTKREFEVLVLLGHGLSIPKAASILHRSPKTLERHKESIGKKLSIHNQADLVQLVTSMGLEIEDTKLTRFIESNNL